MVRLILLFLLFWPLTAGATIALTDRASLYLNKEGVRYRPVSPAWLEKVRQRVGADEVTISYDGRVVHITVVKRPREAVRRIATSLDLRTWFVDKACIRDWEAFHDCLNRQSEPADEALYRRLERDFVAKVTCRKGCENESWRMWRLRWVAPAFMSLEADIGEGGFASLDAAKESLQNINALLKKSLYGARFPEGFGEGRTEYEVFSLDSVTVASFDFGHALRRLLWRLKNDGYLEGIGSRDIEAIEKRAAGGKIVYYIPAHCAGEELRGWYATSNNVHIRFDRRLCPRIRVTR
ncbi:hypothetical protein [Hydrogenimonas sp.]